MIDVQLPGRWNEYIQTLSSANTTQGKILVDVQPPLVDPTISGEVAIPGEAGLRQRLFTGGQRVIDGSISSSDTVARSVYIYIGQQTSLYADMNTGVGTVTITTTNTLTRTLGSFITDGYQVGDTIMLFGATTASNNGVARAITSMTATTLTVSSFPSNDTMVAGFRVVRAAIRTQRALPISAGFADTTPPVVLMGGTQDPASAAQPDLGWSLSARGVVIVAMVGTITSGTFVYCHAISSLY